MNRFYNELNDIIDKEIKNESLKQVKATIKAMVMPYFRDYGTYKRFMVDVNHEIWKEFNND